MKNILIGNGINQFNSSHFTNNSIAKRFKEKITPFWMFYDVYEFGIPIFDIDEVFDYDNYYDNIEKLTMEIYTYINDQCKKKFNVKFNKHLQYRTVNLLKVIAINSIFTNENSKLITPDIPIDIIDIVKSYDNIFSLNYLEYWDSNNIVNYLHGKLNFDEFLQENLSIDDNLYKNDSDYAVAIEFLKEKLFHFPITNAKNLIFSPSIEELSKEDLEIIRCDPTLRPLSSDDFNPKTPIKLYNQLEGLKSIEIFGVSPFGDDLLFKRLSYIPDIKIFVYNKDSMKDEIEKWSKVLPQATLVDSKEFMKF